MNLKDVNKNGNFTGISNIIINEWYTILDLTEAEKNILEKWMSGQTFYVWHDYDLAMKYKPKTVQRWRQKMIEKGYCTVEQVRALNKDKKKWYIRGYRYNFDGLFSLLMSNQGTLEANQDTPEANQDTPVSTDTNTIVKTIVNTNNNQTTTNIFAESRAELIAPVSRQATSNNIIELTEEQQELVDTWTKMYGKPRKGDLKNLSEVDASTIKHIDLWQHYWPTDKYLADKDASLTLFLQNQVKLKKWWSDIDEQAKSHFCAYDFEYVKENYPNFSVKKYSVWKSWNWIPFYCLYFGNVEIGEWKDGHEQETINEKIENLKGVLCRYDRMPVNRKKFDQLTDPKSYHSIVKAEILLEQMTLQPTEEDIFWE